MWEEFPEGGCWIIRIKRKAGQNYVNRMWESLLLSVIGETFEILEKPKNCIEISIDQSIENICLYMKNITFEDEQ